MRFTWLSCGLQFLLRFAFLALGLAATSATAQNTMPHLEQRGDRHALFVDGAPFFVLGGQINNSSSWAGVLPQAWPALSDLHANTVEAPVYWERVEPTEGQFAFGDVDLLIEGARAHGLRLILLWFGTWKNGQNHYVPEWIKEHPERFPREISAYGKVLDVMSPHSPENLGADKRAFAALMHHVREKDAAQHTVIMVQVENESGAIGTVRDHTPAANAEFAGTVPGALTKALHLHAGTWSSVFGADADERFAAYTTALYIGQVAAAGKAEYPLPMYCNVWITYPVLALENRDHPSPGQEYPSGGPQQGNIDLWKATAPAIDLLGPDFYAEDFGLFQAVVQAYDRPDNALFIPETALSHVFRRDLFYALGAGAIGFSPFGIDYTNWTIKGYKLPDELAGGFATLAPMARELAALNFAGKLKTAVETKGSPRQSLNFGDVEAVVSYGYPQRDGDRPPGTPDAHGRALVAQLAPMEFLVTADDGSVIFRLSQQAAKKNLQLEVLRADEGQYVNGVWQTTRIWNGDQTDRGLNFERTVGPAVVRIRLHTLPLLADEAAKSPTTKDQ